MRAAPQALREDREVVMQAVSQDGHALAYAEGGLREDREEEPLASGQCQHRPRHSSCSSISSVISLPLAHPSRQRYASGPRGASSLLWTLYYSYREEEEEGRGMFSG
eukprot:COSAG01_NODE_38337_length_491_cov_0.464286_1_plen_107_part_00